MWLGKGEGRRYDLHADLRRRKNAFPCSVGMPQRVAAGWGQHQPDPASRQVTPPVPRAAPFLLDLGPPEAPPERGSTGGEGKGGGPRPGEMVTSLPSLPTALWREARMSLTLSQQPSQTVKRLPAMRETGVRFPGWEDPLEKAMAIHSSTLAWKIPWTEEPDRLQSMGSQRVRHD